MLEEPEIDNSETERETEPLTDEESPNTNLLTCTAKLNETFPELMTAVSVSPGTVAIIILEK